MNRARPTFDSGPWQLVVMGVSGAGKSTIGRLLAEAIDYPFLDGDDLHSVEAVQKMRGGVPLTEEDRAPWLAAIVLAMEEKRRGRQGGVFACSALRRAYRDRLSGRDVHFIYLQESPAVIRQRLTERQGHFMPTTLIDDQFETLEPPRGDERVMISLPADTPRERCRAILDQLAAARLRTHDAHKT